LHIIHAIMQNIGAGATPALINLDLGPDPSKPVGNKGELSR
jgi:hypothetical protein